MNNMKTYSENTIKIVNIMLVCPQKKNKIIILGLTSERINDKTAIAVKGFREKYKKN